MLTSADDDLERIGLLDQRSNEGFERLASLAVRVVAAPVAMITIVLPDRRREFVKGAAGLPPSLAGVEELPLSHSLCQHVRARGAPLVVADAREDALLRDNSAVTEFGVVAYLAAPVHGPDGVPIGALCTIDFRPRSWTAAEEALVIELAGVADEQIALLAAVYQRDRAAAEAERATRAKSHFLADMSHEIRTPLFGMIGLAELLEDMAGDADQRRLSATIRESGAALMTVLDDILDLSKIEEGKLELERIAFSPLDVLRRAEALHDLAARRKGVTLQVEAAEGGGAARLGDPHRFRQIVNNLLGNAVKFTQCGSVRLRLAGGVGDALTVEVRDSGVGMTEAQVARIFEPFEQSEDSTTRRFGGTGLGMSIVRRLVDRMDGTIVVESVLRRGTTVRLRLPLPVAPAGVEPHPEPVARRDLAFLDGLSVLAVDDNATNRIILDGLLSRLGVKVTVAGSGREALDLWRPGAFDLMLFDISMPEMDGLTLLAAVTDKARALGCGAPPAIAVTASTMVEQVEQCLAAGFDAHVAKPFQRADLLKEMARILWRRRRASA